MNPQFSDSKKTIKTTAFGKVTLKLSKSCYIINTGYNDESVERCKRRK